MQETIDKLNGYLIQYGMNVVGALVIFLLGKWFARIISHLIEKILLKSKVDQTLAAFAKNISYFTILTFVCIAALNKLGVETNSFLAIIGAAGLAVGLALQGSLSNFAAGVMMIIFHPFRIGDYVETAGTEGTVQEIQIFNTIIMNREKTKRIIVPNAKVTSDKISVHLVK